MPHDGVRAERFNVWNGIRHANSSLINEVAATTVPAGTLQIQPDL